MHKAWYIISYHNIDWGQNVLSNRIGGTITPIEFRNALDVFHENFEILSPSDAMNKTLEGQLKNPVLSIWFDDGLLGVKKYSLEILEKYNIKPGYSICSNFLLRQDMFWRFKLSYIINTKGVHFLYDRMKKYEYNGRSSLRKFTIDHFSLEMVSFIDDLYKSCCSKEELISHYNIYETIEGVKHLIDKGWEIANHSASHYPIGEDIAISYFKEEFLECERKINDLFGIRTKYWVLPFDRQNMRSDKINKMFTSIENNNRYLVYVGNKYNQQINNSIYRIGLPYTRKEDIYSFLKNIK